MEAIDILGSVGEIISWFGLGFGLPALLLGLLLRAHSGRWQPIQIVLVEESNQVFARWYAAHDFWERRLTAAESIQWRGSEMVTAFVSERRPHLMRFEPRNPFSHAIYLVGLTLSSAGAVGLILSFVPLFIT